MLNNESFQLYEQKSQLSWRNVFVEDVIISFVIRHKKDLTSNLIFYTLSILNLYLHPRYVIALNIK